MTKDEALKLALEALALAGGNLCEALHHPKKLQHGIGEPCPAVAKYDKTIAAIKEALAQPTEKYTYGTPLLDAINGKGKK